MNHKENQIKGAQLVNGCYASSIPRSYFIFFLITGVITEKKSALDQEMKFSCVVSSSVAGPEPVCIGLAHRDHVLVNRGKHTEGK